MTVVALVYRAVEGDKVEEKGDNIVFITMYSIKYVI